MDVIREEIGVDVWDQAENEVRNSLNLHHNVRRKNPILAAATVENLFDKGIEIQNLNRLGVLLLEYASAVQRT